MSIIYFGMSADDPPWLPNQFRGFLGQYDVQMTDGGKEQTVAMHLQKGKPNVWTFTLDR